MVKSIWTLQIATNFVLYGLLFIQIPVTIQANVFDFQEVVRQNKQFTISEDGCTEKIFDARIVTKTSEVPYQVVIRRAFDEGKQWWGVCGGAIITTTHVLTSAHCFHDTLTADDLREFRVIAGTIKANSILFGDRKTMTRMLELLYKEETWRLIIACHKHQSYRKTDEGVLNIAVIELDKELAFSDNIRPIRMLSDGLKFTLRDGMKCLSSGFGTENDTYSSKQLTKACVPVVDFETCKQVFPLTSNITQFCAGANLDQVVTSAARKGVCVGDIGGPLVCQGILVGVVTEARGSCNGMPAVYALLSGYTIHPRTSFVNDRSTKVNYNVLEIVVVILIPYIYCTFTTMDVL